MAIKEASTNYQNKLKIISACPVTFTLSKIGGRWKPLILFHLLDGDKRYSEIRKSIPHITEKMLIQHLRELEEDQLIKRKALPVIPPHVEYSLTKLGDDLRPILSGLRDWGLKYNKPKKSKIISPC